MSSPKVSDDANKGQLVPVSDSNNDAVDAAPSNAVANLKGRTVLKYDEVHTVCKEFMMWARYVHEYNSRSAVAHAISYIPIIGRLIPQKATLPDVPALLGALSTVEKFDIDDDQARELVLTASVAMKALKQIMKQPSVRGVTSSMSCMSAFEDLLRTKLGASEDLCDVAEFSWLGRDCHFDQNLLLHQGFFGLELVHADDIDASEDQLPIMEHLEGLTAALRSESEVDKLTINNLINLKAFVERLILSYANNQAKGLEMTGSMIARLFEMREQIDSGLQRRPKELAAFWELNKSHRYHGRTARLLNDMEEMKGYHKDFWKNPGHAEILEAEHAANLEAYVRGIADPESLSLGKLGLKLLSEEPTTGLRLYLDEKSEPQKVVLFCPDHEESKMAHYDHRQDRDGRLFQVTAHKRVLDKAGPAWKQLEKMLAELETEHEGICKLPLVSVGFGLGGAVAQMLAWQLSKERELEGGSGKCHSFCFGVPEYMWIDDAQKMRDQNNYYAINFGYVNDKYRHQSGLSEATQFRLSGHNFRQYPLHNRGQFFLDFSGHDKGNYTTALKDAVKVSLQLRKMYSELSSLKTILSNPSEPGLLLEYFNPDQKGEVKLLEDAAK